MGKSGKSGKEVHAEQPHHENVGPPPRYGVMDGIFARATLAQTPRTDHRPTPQSIGDSGPFLPRHMAGLHLAYYPGSTSRMQVLSTKLSMHFSLAGWTIGWHPGKRHSYPSSLSTPIEPRPPNFFAHCYFQ